MSEASPKGKAVQVKITTDIRDGHRKETTSFQAEGVYYEKGNMVYLTYKEKQEEGEVNTIVKIAKDEVSLMRSGAVKVKQQFRKREQTSTTYVSPYGPLHMEIFTHNFEYKRLKTKGNLFITYDLCMQGQQTGKYTLTISFKEEPINEHR